MKKEVEYEEIKAKLTKNDKLVIPDFIKTFPGEPFAQLYSFSTDEYLEFDIVKALRVYRLLDKIERLQKETNKYFYYQKIMDKVYILVRRINEIEKDRKLKIVIWEPHEQDVTILRDKEDNEKIKIRIPRKK